MIEFVFFLMVALVVWAVVVYNRLQRLMQGIRQYLSNLQAALKKRIDLTQQIVDIAAGYSEHEKLTHFNVNKPQEVMQQVLALGQSYPDLKANETYRMLMGQLENIEQTILDRREAYNARVNDYNSYRNAMPQVLIAGKLSFEIAPYFEMDDPDFLDKAKIFQRDDSEALQKMLAAGGETVRNKTLQAKETIQKKLDAATEDSSAATANADSSDGAAHGEDGDGDGASSTGKSS